MVGVPVGEAPPAERPVKGAEGKALSRFDFPVVVSAIPQIVSVHVVGAEEGVARRPLGSHGQDQRRPRPGGVREGCVAGVVGGVWGAMAF